MLTTDLILGRGLSPPASLNPLLNQTLYLLNKQAAISQGTSVSLPKGRGENGSLCPSAMHMGERDFPKLFVSSHPNPALA